MPREFEDILQDANALFKRAEAQPPYTVQVLDKAAEVKVEGAQSEATQQRGQAIESNLSNVEQRMLADPNVKIGAFRDKDGRNVIQPWSDSASMFAGFNGNFNLLTQAPTLLREILDLFIEPEPEPEPIPEYVEPPVEPVKLRRLPKTVKINENT